MITDPVEELVVSFTGSQYGMTDVQSLKVFELLLYLRSLLPDEEDTPKPEFNHGGCIGADAQAALLAQAAGFATTRWPGDTPDKQDRVVVDDMTMEPMTNRERNAKLVQIGDVLIVGPRGNYETQRSGTWMTVRMARKSQTPHVIVWPNGVHEEVG